ncbi:unnamed protein product [Ambrosiozyma monospora]|uniref:Unnamed protein product n=1 Tax=Ambrosiozyma monospora TaxID=43982 RepID=A0ACB5TFK4_AMBMO|nr:unnamed protein product [Ambrosiozyma monospora]
MTKTLSMIGDLFHSKSSINKETITISSPYNFRKVELTNEPSEFVQSLSSLKEASYHFELPEDISLEPARQLIQLLKHTIREHQPSLPKKPKKMSSRLTLRPNVESVQYSDEWYGSHLLMSVEDKQLAKKLVNKCFSLGAQIPNDKYMDIVDDFRNNLEHNCDSGYILENSKPVSDFGHYCLNSKSRVFEQFPNTRHNFTLFWTVAVNEWRQMDADERKRQSWFEAIPEKEHVKHRIGENGLDDLDLDGFLSDDGSDEFVNYGVGVTTMTHMEHDVEPLYKLQPEASKQFYSTSSGGGSEHGDLIRSKKKKSNDTIGGGYLELRLVKNREHEKLMEKLKDAAEEQETLQERLQREQLERLEQLQMLQKQHLPHDHVLADVLQQTEIDEQEKKLEKQEERLEKNEDERQKKEEEIYAELENSTNGAVDVELPSIPETKDFYNNSQEQTFASILPDEDDETEEAFNLASFSIDKTRSDSFSGDADDEDNTKEGRLCGISKSPALPFSAKMDSAAVEDSKR